jgi:hypothetical protein
MLKERDKQTHPAARLTAGVFGFPVELLINEIYRYFSFENVLIWER